VAVALVELLSSNTQHVWYRDSSTHRTVFTARCYTERGIATAGRPSVCPVCDAEVSLSHSLLLLTYSFTLKLKVNRYSSSCTYTSELRTSPGTPAICNHTVLPATWHRWTHPTFTPASEGWYSIYLPGGMEGWVAMAGYIPRWFNSPQTVTHPSINRARRRATMLIETNYTAKPRLPPTFLCS